MRGNYSSRCSGWETLVVVHFCSKKIHTQGMSTTESSLQNIAWPFKNVHRHPHPTLAPSHTPTFFPPSVLSTVAQNFGSRFIPWRRAICIEARCVRVVCHADVIP